MIVVNLGTAQQLRCVIFTLSELSGIVGGNDADDARGSFRAGEVHRCNSTLRNAGTDDVAVCGRRKGIVPFVGVSCRARRLERAVDPACRVSDDLELVDRIAYGGGVAFYTSNFFLGKNPDLRAPQ